MTDSVQELLNISVAAEYLSKHLTDKTPEQWRLALQNNRSTSRAVSFRIPFEKLGGGVFYDRDELVKFVEFEKMRQLGTLKLTGRAAEALKAIGFGEAGGSSTGKSFKVSSVTLALDEGDARRKFVQIATTEPLQIFRVELDAARLLASELNDILSYLDRSEGK